MRLGGQAGCCSLQQSTDGEHVAALEEVQACSGLLQLKTDGEQFSVLKKGLYLSNDEVDGLSLSGEPLAKVFFHRIRL